MLPKKLILIVEDDEKSRRLMRDVLAFQGYDIVETDRGEVAIALIRTHHPSLVLMDIHLPGMSGVQALQEIRDDGAIAKTPVIAVTASVMDKDREKVRNAGFDGFHPKPLNLKAFLMEVKQFIAA
ncbi:MAG: response regulator [Betaproteobacteria bacterium]|nr:response regulator [Betaproteobacteria bacterium]